MLFSILSLFIYMYVCMQHMDDKDKGMGLIMTWTSQRNIKVKYKSQLGNLTGLQLML